MSLLSPPLLFTIESTETEPRAYVVGGTGRHLESEPFLETLKSSPLLCIAMKLIGGTDTPSDFEMYTGAMFSMEFMVVTLTKLLAREINFADEGFSKKTVLSKLERQQLQNWLSKESTRKALEEDKRQTAEDGLRLAKMFESRRVAGTVQLNTGARSTLSRDTKK
jgi:hypothetical protein